MALTNVMLAQSFASITNTATCGLSAVVSASLGSPGPRDLVGGRLTVCVANLNANAALHVQGRVKFVDAAGVERTAIHTINYSNGVSSVSPRHLVYIASGATRSLIFNGIVGKTFQVALMKASNNALNMSAMVTIWAT